VPTTLRMPLVGTERTWRRSCCMSVIGATADGIYSQRVFHFFDPKADMRRKVPFGYEIRERT
jgi:hypothetical protein